MRKLLPFTALFLLSVSLAAPLIGSKNSFAESNFCKRWKCQFVSSAVVPNYPGTRSFNYALPDGAVINIGRENNVIVSSVMVGYTRDAADRFMAGAPKAAQYLPDLLASLTGVRTSSNIFSECINGFDGSPFFTGPDHKLGRYTVFCGRGQNLKDSSNLLFVQILEKD